jgi:hypothetical protein
MKVEVKVRSDKERGLFAVEDIKKNEFVCILPIDYFQLDSEWYSTEDRLNTPNTPNTPNTTNTSNTPNTSNINFRYGILFEIPKKQKNDQLHNFKEFINKTNNSFQCFKKVIYNKKIDIVGVSNENRIEDDFIGHMINDYVNMVFLTENKYETLSNEYSNVEVSSKLEIFERNNKVRLGLRITAIKNIKKNTELFLTYGSKYWKTYSNNNKCIYKVNLKTLI